MDPVTLIASALAVGATAALQETAGAAIKDGYQGLVWLIRKKLGDDEKAKLSLDRNKKTTKRHQKVLEKLVVDKGLAHDKDILKQAQKLHKLIQASGFSQNNIEVYGNVNAIVNENKGHMTLNFNAPDQAESKKKNKTRG